MSANYTQKVREGHKYDASIDDYFDDVVWIWERDKTERSVLDLWLHVVDHCTRLVEAVRKERPRDVIDDLADTVMWLFSFLAQTHDSKHNIDQAFRVCEKPSDLIWNKFPAYCPACLDYEFTKIIDQTPADDVDEASEKATPAIKEWIAIEAEKSNAPTPCHCLSRIEFVEERHLNFKGITPVLDDFRLLYAETTRSIGKKIIGMSELQSMFEAIFGNAYQVFSVQNIAFHLLEEVGEVSQALKDCYTFDENREPFSEELLRRRKMKLKEEIADVFSWLHALMLKIKHVYYRDAQEYFQSLLSSQQLVTVHFQKLVESISLPDIIWAKYGVTSDGKVRDTLCCAACFCAPCECKRDLRINWTTNGVDIDITGKKSGS